jgi:hypothetical protein
MTVQPPVVRATATGAVTATIRCPWPGAQVAQQGIAASGNQTFFMICEKRAQRNNNPVVTGSRIYRFQLTGSGRVSDYSAIPVGALGSHSLDGIAASPDGSQLAVSDGPATVGAASSAPENVLVINTRTGARAVWRSGTEVRSAADLTFTHNGRDLEFIGLKQCAQDRSGTACEQLRAISPPAAGGQLDSSRVIMPMSALARSAADSIEDVVIEPGGSTLIAAVVHTPSQPHSSTSILVTEYSTTGRQLRVLYQMRTGDGFFYRFLSSDPTGRYLLFNAGPTSATVNGWINHGQLIRLKPANGSNVFYETW